MRLYPSHPSRNVIPMSETTDTQNPEEPTAAPALRLPSARASAVLATIMLGLGVAVGAAIGPSPASSYAESPAGLAQRLPQLLALLASRSEARTAAATASPAAPAAAPAPAAAQAPAATAAPASTATPTAPATAPASAGGEGASSGTEKTAASPTKKLPAIAHVWLITLSGGSFAEATAKPTAAPYITGTLLPGATLLGGWSAISAGAFASEAALAEPPSPGATPPLVRTIVQPPCPEGAAGAACAPGSPGALTAADEFLKATLATITSTPAYREHGLVVVTFATVAIAAQSGLPAGASTSTLTYEPPAGVALLSPFAKPGASAVAFNPTSPRQSLEKLLH